MRTPKWSRRRDRLLRAAVGIVAACVGAVAQAQGGPHAVAGAVRDSVSRQAIAGAIIGVLGPGFDRATRTDERGEFRLTGVPAGSYRLVARQIGYVEWSRDVRVDDSDVVIDVLLARPAQGLDTVHVDARVTGIRGVVGTARDLRPIAGAKVQVISAEHDALTDSAGLFFVGLKQAGAYVMRVSRTGYAAHVLSVDVARDHTVETSTLLDSSAGGPKDADALWADFVSRVRMRGPHSALVPGAEVRKYGGSLTEALRGAPSFGMRGLRIGPTTCVFVNGRPEPGLWLDSYHVDQVETIELYGPTGDATGSLATSWPRGARCGENSGAERSREPASNVAMWAVLWLRQ